MKMKDVNLLESSEFQHLDLIQKPSRDAFMTQAVGLSPRKQHVLFALTILSKLTKMSAGNYTDQHFLCQVYNLLNLYSPFAVTNLKLRQITYSIFKFCLFILYFLCYIIFILLVT